MLAGPQTKTPSCPSSVDDVDSACTILCRSGRPLKRFKQVESAVSDEESESARGEGCFSVLVLASLGVRGGGLDFTSRWSSPLLV
jgi:hypothetical protein